MKAITIKLTNCLTALALGVAMCLSAVSCQKDELTDGDKFALYYPGITDIGPSTNMDLTPTYHGAKASKFEIYNVTLDGKTYQTESFSIDPESGMLSLRNTDGGYPWRNSGGGLERNIQGEQRGRVQHIEKPELPRGRLCD